MALESLLVRLLRPLSPVIIIIILKKVRFSDDDSPASSPSCPYPGTSNTPGFRSFTLTSPD